MGVAFGKRGGLCFLFPAFGWTFRKDGRQDQILWAREKDVSSPLRPARERNDLASLRCVSGAARRSVPGFCAFPGSRAISRCQSQPQPDRSCGRKAQEIVARFLVARERKQELVQRVASPTQHTLMPCFIIGKLSSTLKTTFFFSREFKRFTKNSSARGGTGMVSRSHNRRRPAEPGARP